ncbi:MAG: DEAD/DEAH box helicase, partial [Candidatus Thorarchaeota archaeon]
MKRVNNFMALKSLREDYRSYVSTFQKYRNPRIADWVRTRIETGTLLWQEPLVELNRRFQTGKSISDFISEDHLDKRVRNMFLVNPDNSKSPVIELYRHQSESISKVLEHEANIVVTTGTGSGKSFCFGIPIISECLRMVTKGVKAVLVYPMNALINSQYEAFARILKDSGLKIAKYTGETKNSPEEARELLKKVSDREPYDSELVSRDEIRKTPPDILMT